MPLNPSDYRKQSAYKWGLPQDFTLREERAPNRGELVSSKNISYSFNSLKVRSPYRKRVTSRQWLATWCVSPHNDLDCSDGQILGHAFMGWVWLQDPKTDSGVTERLPLLNWPHYIHLRFGYHFYFYVSFENRYKTWLGVQVVTAKLDNKTHQTDKNLFYHRGQMSIFFIRENCKIKNSL